MEDGKQYFKLSELRSLYQNRLNNFGVFKEINKVRFKEQILSHFPDAQAQNDGKSILIVFKKGMQQMLKQSSNCKYEGDALILSTAAKIIREDIFNFGGFQFNGFFPSDCQQNSIPTNLKYLVSMLLNGPDINDQESVESQCSLTIAQTIYFNCKRKRPIGSNPRHSAVFEPPLPLYIGMQIHTQTRSKKLITELLGVSVSYDRILQLENQLATSVCERTKEIGIVCPIQLRHGLFTVGALDNIDHNPSSTTAKDSFHGTGISLFQFPSESNMGRIQTKIQLSKNQSKNLQLPEIYTTVPAVALKKESVSVPKPCNSITTISGYLQEAYSKERVWLEHAMRLLEKVDLQKGDAVTWASYHASCTNKENLYSAITQLLPLFYEKAATAAMVKHGMTVQLQATQFLNPGQIPVTAVDAPLYALAKLVQWKWPATHGEDKHVVMMDGLHIEMAMWTTIGDYLEASGWTTALTQANVASSGTADSFLRASHLTRTRHGHQVSVLALSKLQEEAFSSGTHESYDEDAKEAWRQSMIKSSPTFQNWDTILRFELLGLIFVRAHCERNFHLFIESLKAIVPLFFALDHHHYARWLPIHIRDMEALPISIYNEFREHGRWVISKTQNRFSAMPIDQAHEQNNAVVKGSGGAVGLTENPSALRKWLTAGPEQARIILEFEKAFERSIQNTCLHHEEGFSAQKTFKQQVLALVEAIRK